MGDFEDVFGVGADADAIIASYNREHKRYGHEFYGRKATFLTRKTFSSFQEASEWAKNNPGKTIARESDGHGFIVKDEGKNK